MNGRSKVVAVTVYSAALAVCACEECADCMEEKCADLVRICEQDEGFDCMAQCIGSDGIDGLQGCYDKCGLVERPPGFASLEECVAFGCPDGDECSTPDDYQPPKSPATDDTSALEAHGGGDLADCALEPGLSFDPEGPVLQLQSANKRVCELRRLSAGVSWGVAGREVRPHLLPFAPELMKYFRSF